MKLTTRACYSAPMHTVLRMFADRAFHERKHQRMQLTRFVILEHQADAQQCRVRVERVVPMQAPSVLKKLLPAHTTAVYEEQWDLRSGAGRVQVQPQGTPLDLRCTAQAVDRAGGCDIDYHWEITARVPLVGGALEKFVAGDLETRMAEENRLAESLLGDHR